MAFTHTYPRQDSSGISGLVFSIFGVIMSLGGKRWRLNMEFDGLLVLSGRSVLRRLDWF